MPRNPHLYGAVYGIVVNENGEILMLKRQNTGCFDDGYCFPAGHIEDGETSNEAMIRELEEEVGLKTDKKSIIPIAMLHRVSNRQYFDICYLINKYEGKPTNAELDKSTGIFWFSKKNMPDYMAHEIKIFIDHYFKYGKELKYYTFKE